MLLVILGAGASYDSGWKHNLRVDGFEWRPPLANQLFVRPNFEPLIGRYPDALAVVPDLANVPEGTNLERVMDGLQKEAKSHPQRHKQMTAIRHYLRDLLSTCTFRWLEHTSHLTNYYPLLDQLQIWRERTKQEVVIVNFNYDLLLKDALPTVGVSLSTNLNSYILQDGWKVIKPHGSVNWARLSEAQALASEIAETYRVVDYRNFPGNMSPAIAIPVESVKDFECPSTHMRALEDSLQPGGWQLLIIGWKATEMNFLEILARYIPRNSRFVTTIVCGSASEAQVTQNNLARAIDLSHVNLYEAGFTEFVVRKDALRMLP